MLGEGAEIANTAIALGIKAAQKALPIALTGVNYVKKKRRHVKCIKDAENGMRRRKDCDHIIKKKSETGTGKKDDKNSSRFVGNWVQVVSHHRHVMHNPYSGSL